jgi:tetratricopeptide (TPR) repeat protein
MSVKHTNLEGYQNPIAPKDTVSRYQQLKSINMEVLGERLRRARIEKKISQRDLSAGLFTSAYLSSLELGKTRPTLNTLEQLASLLGKSPDYFLRPTSGHNLDETLDEEQSRALELRQRLLSAQVYLEHSASDQLAQILQQVGPALVRLSATDRARYHYLNGRYHYRSGNLPEALSSLQQAQQLALQGQNDPSFNYANAEPELQAQIEYALGEANLVNRQSMAALNHFTAGLEALTPNSNPALRWKLLAGAAGCYRLLNDPEQAQAYYQKALEQASSNTSARQAEYYYKRAGQLSEQGDFQRAALYYGRSIQLYEMDSEQEILERTCLNLAQLQVQVKEYGAAREVAELALRLSQDKKSDDAANGDELSALVLLATIYHRQGDLAGASNYLEQATRLLEAGAATGNLEGSEPGEQSLFGQYYQVAAELKADQGEREAAEGYYQKALETLEARQSQGTGADEALGARLLAEVYYSYGRRLKDWNDTQKSLELMERAYRLSTGKGRG